MTFVAVNFEPTTFAPAFAGRFVLTGFFDPNSADHQPGDFDAIATRNRCERGITR